MALWESVRSTSDIPSLQRYLDRFPNGVFASTARQMMERLTAEVAQRQASLQFEIERKAQEAKQAADLQRALDDARKAREALSSAERERASAQAAAANARAAVAAATEERNTAALREEELRKEQQRLLAEAASASGRSTAERNAATAELEGKLAAVAGDARAAREALAAAEARQQSADRAAQVARDASQTASDRDAASRVAFLATPESPNGPAAPLGREQLARRLQAELKRVGCYAGEVDGEWGAGSRTALEGFIKRTGFLFDTANPGLEPLDAVASQRVRICPLQCGSGEVERGDRCIAAPARVPVPGREDAPVKTRVTPREAPATPRAATRPDGNRYSLSIWPKNTLQRGQTVSANTPFGRLTCTSIAANTPRACSWR